jgi:hypothetical protein
VLVFWGRKSLDGYIYAASYAEMERLLRRTEAHKNKAGVNGKSN